MSALFDWNLWWPLPGLLAAQTAALVGLAALLQGLVQAAAWRRTIWQACVLGLVILVALEITGAAHTLTSLVTPQRLPERPTSAELTTQPVTSPDPALFARGEGLVVTPSQERPWAAPPGSVDDTLSAKLETEVQVSAPILASGKSATRLLPWLLMIWVVGAGAVIVRSCFAYFLFCLLRRGGNVVRHLDLNERTGFLSRKLGLRRSVRIIESPRLSGPVAFGVLRPGIGLPPSFATLHHPAQQEVMLAHELAHLTAGDPVWYTLADMATALLWWHPGAWWARRQLHAASEAAADEASLLVANGPGVLAECLVALGARLAQPRAARWLGIEGNGFRSGLGRRVQRLVNLGGRVWSPPGWRVSALAKTAGPAALVSATLVCTAWTLPESSNNGATMKQWKQALSVLTLATAFGIEQAPLSAEPPVKTQPKSREDVVVAYQTVSAPPATVDVRTEEIRPPESKTAPALRQKLEQIVLPEVLYDNLPLSEVIRQLIAESAGRDPQKTGVNFLFGQKFEANLATVDPATGLPVAAPRTDDFDLRSVSIRIMPALKNVRLIDVLDAITKVADVPIQYSIGEYAVVFTRDIARTYNSPPQQQSPALQPLQTRAFKVNTNTFFASIERMFGEKLNPVSNEVGLDLRERIFPKLGARVTSPDAVVLYNDLTGILLVRASAEELVAVQAVIETLGGAPTTSAAVKPSNSSSFLKHLAEGPHVHLHRAVTGMFDALGNLAPPPFNSPRR